MGPSQHFRSRLAAFCVWVSMSALGACTESHDVEAPDAAGSGQEGSRGGRGGTGGSGGSGNSANSVSCDKQCAASMVLGVAVPACCTDDNKCGLDLSGLGIGEGCAEMNAVGSANAACPAVNLLGFYPLEGCCRPDGKCGVLDTFAGLGCTTAGAAEGMTCQP